ncbi:MAG: hypothetical protein ACRYGR_10720 [Janthinobacterium lividum]
MRGKTFFYLSLINFLFSVESFKSQASMQDICEDFVTSGATQKIASTYTYIANNGSSLIHQLTDMEFNKMCCGFLKPVTNIIIEQMPQLYINQVPSDYSDFVANLTISVVGVGVTCVGVGAAVYFGYKEYRGKQADVNSLVDFKEDLISLNMRLTTLEKNTHKTDNSNIIDIKKKQKAIA